MIMSLKIENNNSFIVNVNPKIITTKNINVYGIGIISVKSEYDLSNISDEHHQTCISMIENGL
jgi:hypothetical protein